jgi:uncharacterized protein (TIGR02646 family)
MIKVEKDLLAIPDILKENPSKGISRKIVFQGNIDSKKYIDDKNSYKVKSIQKKLKSIYNNKCVYCEKSLLDSPKHIEHYRPKNIYYWLAYSWDNLLLACGECNSSKGKRFKIKNAQVKYNNESFNNIHTLSHQYNIEEEPFIVNPEKEDILDKINFDKNATISSFDIRVSHTIEACNLNRDDIVEKRVKIFNDFKKVLEEHWFLFVKEQNNISRFEPNIKMFIHELKKENEFYAFRYFLLKNLDIFFDNKNLIKIIVKFKEKIQ